MLRAVRLTALALTLLPVLADRAGAQPTCTAGTLAQYMGLGSSGCTYAGFRLSGFGPATFSPGRAATNPGSIVLTPFVRGLEPQWGLGLGEFGFTVSFLTPMASISPPGGGTGPSFRFTYQIGDHPAGSSILSGIRVGALDVTRIGEPYDITGEYAGASVFMDAYYTSFMGRQQSIGACATYGLSCFGIDWVGGITGNSELRVRDMRVNVYAEASTQVRVINPPDQTLYARLNSFEATVGLITPEPSTYALLGTGLLAIGIAARRRRSA